MNKSNKAKVGKPTGSSPQSVVGNNSPQSRNTTPSRNKSDKEAHYEGIYKNLRFCETITSLMGNTVQIQLLDGNIFEGIFSTFSPQLEVVLELVHTVDPSEPDKINVESVTSKVIFRSQMIVMMSSKDVELDFATKDFVTDSSISRFNGGLSGEKELEPWDADGDDCNISLDNANGWDPNEMFAKNEKVYGVQSNFEQDLSQYTCKLERRDSLEFKEREAQASMLARSIEGNAASKAQTELENASDEEEKFSAVVRPGHGASGGSGNDQPRERRDFRDFGDRTRGPMGSGNSGSNSNWEYVLPHKRPPNKSGMQSMNKMMRPTPPPHGAHGPHSNMAPRHQAAGGGGGGSYHGGNSYDGNNSGPGAHHGGGYQHQSFQGAARGRGGSSAGGPYYNRPQGGPPGGYNSSRNNANQQSSSNASSRQANGEEQRKVHPRESSYDSLNKPGLPQRDHGPKDQRKGFMGKTRDDQNSDLKRFGQDFRLALTSPAVETAPADDNKKTTPSPTTGPSAATVAAAPATTTAAATTTSSAPPHSSSNNKTNSSPTPSAPASVPPAVAPSASTTPATSGTGRSNAVSPVQNSAATPVVAPASSGGPGAREASPQEDGKATAGSSEPVDKVSDTLKKSSLNPNAKEFVLNPNARVFIPTPPRSHTPQTQQGGGGQMMMPSPMGSMGPGGPVMAGSASPGQTMSLVPVVHYMQNNPGGVMPNQGAGGGGGGGGGNQPQYSAHNPRFPRKPSPMPVNHRPDLASSMHVAAATGQPLMAPAPMGGPQLFYPPQGAMLPGTPQPYTPMFTMRLVGPNMQGMQMQVPNSAYADSSTTGHGPIYMSPGHGGQGGVNQGQMGPPQPQQQQHGGHGHPNSAPSPAQQHSMAGPSPSGNPPQLIYQTAGGHHGHNPGPPHNHPHHASFPMVFLPPGHSQMPPGGPSGGPGAPQGVQLLPLGSSAAATAAGMAAMGMAIPQIHYIQQAPGNQAVHRLA